MKGLLATAAALCLVGGHAGEPPDQSGEEVVWAGGSSSFDETGEVVPREEQNDLVDPLFTRPAAIDPGFNAPFRPPPKLNPFKKGFGLFMPGPVLGHPKKDVAPEGDMTPGGLEHFPQVVPGGGFTKDLPHGGTKDLPHGARPGRSEGRPAYPVPEQEVVNNELMPGAVIRHGRSEGRPATPVSDNNGLENLEDSSMVTRGGGKDLPHGATPRSSGGRPDNMEHFPQVTPGGWLTKDLPHGDTKEVSRGPYPGRSEGRPDNLEHFPTVGDGSATKDLPHPASPEQVVNNELMPGAVIRHGRPEECSGCCPAGFQCFAPDPACCSTEDNLEDMPTFTIDEDDEGTIELEPDVVIHKGRPKDAVEGPRRRLRG